MGRPLSQKTLKKQLEDLKMQKIEALHKQSTEQYQYEHNNRIEFFGIADPERAKAHDKCCKLFRGPNPIQKQLLDAWGNPRYKTFTFTGGRKTGKTTIGPGVIGPSMMFGYWPWDEKKTPISNPPVKIRLIGQDWGVHIKSVLIPALKHWWPKNRAVITKKNNEGVEALWTDVKTKSTLEIMSNKSEIDVFEGWDGTVVIYDEPPKRDVRVSCAGGLAVTNGRELFTATLLKEAWIHRDIIKALGEDGRPDPRVFNVHGEIWDNLGFGMSQEGIENFASKMTPEEAQARLLGIPSYMSGLIYPQFDRQIHLKKRFKIPLEYIIDIHIDTHPAKEQAVLFMATDPRNYKYLCDEIWMHGDGTEIGEEIIRYINRNSYRVENVKIDHSAKGDSNNTFTTYEKIEAVLNRHDLSLSTYKKDEDGGIKSARTLLKGPNNEPSLFIFDDLPRTIFEIEGYMIDPKTGKTQNYDNDMMDGLYALANEDTQWHSVAPKRRAKPANWKIA